MFDYHSARDKIKISSKIKIKRNNNDSDGSDSSSDSDTQEQSSSSNSTDESQSSHSLKLLKITREDSTSNFHQLNKNNLQHHKQFLTPKKNKNKNKTKSGKDGRKSKQEDEHYQSLDSSFADEEELLLINPTDIPMTEEEMHELHMIDVENQLQEMNESYVDYLKTQFFGLGFSSGMAFQMFVVSILIMFVSYSNDSGPLKELSHEYYPVFRSIFFIAFFFTLYGCNLFIWRRSKIEYRSVMQVSKFHTYQYVLRGASTTAYIVFCCFMMYILTLTGGLEGINITRSDKHIFPMLAFVLPSILFFCPFDHWTEVCYGVTSRGYSQRVGMLKQLMAVLCSPFSEVTFIRTFIADILCSMPRIFTDCQYTLCIYITGTYWDQQDEWDNDGTHMHAYMTCGSGSTSYVWLQGLLSFAPYFLRLMQTMRVWTDTGEVKHLFNATKYGLSLTVTGLALARKNYPDIQCLNSLWFAVSSVTTLYAFYWDVYMDWGLGSWTSKHFFLREELYYSPRSYYVAIVLDLVMRLGWAILISPAQNYVAQHIVLLLGCVELFRRFMWSIFRVEWEYIKIKAKNGKH